MAKNENLMNILGNGTKFKGKMNISGSLRIDGEFDGNLSISETLIVGKSGFIKGEIKSKNSVVGGKISGNLSSLEKVELQAGAIFDGELACKKLIIEEGVLFDGSCRMSEVKGASKQEKAKPAEIAK